MLTTTQVRAVIRANSTSTYGIYTNKTRKNCGDERSVKCYFRGNTKLLNLLRKLAGAENVKLTVGAQHYYAGGAIPRSAGITVKCILG